MTFTTLINLEPPKKCVAICTAAPEIKHTESSYAHEDLMLYASRDFTLHRTNVEGSDVVAARNLLVVGGRQANPIAYLFLDADNTYPENTLHRLLAHDKDIVGATYVRRKPPYAALGARADEKHIDTIWDESGLVEMAHMPFGCLLVKAHVFPKLDKPYFRHLYNIQAADNDIPGGLTSEDHAFCERTRALGLSVWCDVDLSRDVGHQGMKTFYWNSPERLDERYKQA